ncbi:MAG: VOC family protein, partial [Rhodospirillaceae bacterium]|nr:VOC family protein [Rhodospirillaceae bacterium]
MRASLRAGLSGRRGARYHRATQFGVKIVHGNVHALGMFLRFAPKGSTAPAFYRTTLKLPLIRVVGDKIADIYWAGEASVFEIVYVKDKTPAPEPSPERAACLPVFRVHELDALLADLRAAGATISAPSARGAGREAFVRDPDGYWLGLRERDAGASSAADVEA